MRDTTASICVVQLGDLLFGRVRGEDVDELVLSICHVLLLQDARGTRVDVAATMHGGKVR